MPEHRLKPLCALGSATAQIDRFDGLTLRENPDLAMASVAIRAGRDKDFAKAAQKLFGFALPKPGDMAGKGEWTAFWTGPGQWMVTAAFASHEDIARIVKAGLGDTASVTEQTDGWVRFEIDGRRAMDMLERLCAVDIRVMQSGAATRTVIEHLGSFVLCLSAGQAFSIITLRSAAGSMHHALITAMKSL